MTCEENFIRCVLENKSFNIVELSLDFLGKKNDQDRVKFCLEKQLLASITLPRVDDEISYKNDKHSEFLRLMGNQHFEKNEFLKACECYTKSICYAVSNEKVSLSYSNRSVVLAKLNHDGCLSDIDNAIEHGYRENNRFKLEERKAKFLLSRNRGIEATKSFENAAKYAGKSQLPEETIKKLINDFQKLSAKCGKENNSSSEPELSTSVCKIETLKLECNPQFPSLSKDVDIKYTEDEGRLVVAKRKFKVGEIIAFEKPYMKMIFLKHLWDHCSVCFKHCLDGLPCHKCPFIVFCSKSCKKQKHNNIECQALKYLHKADIQNCPILAFKTVGSIPPRETSNFSHDKITADVDAERKVIFKDGKYMWNDYRTICNLVTNGEKRSVRDLFDRTFRALYLLKILEATDYFEEVPNNQMDNIKLNVATLILTHMQAYPSNAHSIMEFAINKRNILASSQVEFGCGIYSTLSLFNHSCAPNVTRNDTGEYSIMRAIRTIEKGERIYDNYGFLFQLNPKHQRISELSSQYYFSCKCEACVNDWHLLFNNKKPVWKCLHCGNILQNQNAASYCKLCKINVSLKERLTEFEKKFKIFEKCYQLVLDFKAEEALQGTVDWVEFLGENVHITCHPYTQAVETLKQIYDLLSNRYITYCL